MKELNMGNNEAITFVKNKRDCINPNKNFRAQLKIYEGILNARHNSFWSNLIGNGPQIQRCRSENSLKDKFRSLDGNTIHDQLQSQSTTAITVVSNKHNYRSHSINIIDVPSEHMFTQGVIGIGDQQCSDMDTLDSSDSSSSPISSSPSSQPNEDLIQMIEKGLDIPITQLSSDIEQAKQQKLGAERKRNKDQPKIFLELHSEQNTPINDDVTPTVTTTTLKPETKIPVFQTTTSENYSSNKNTNFNSQNIDWRTKSHEIFMCPLSSPTKLKYISASTPSSPKIVKKQPFTKNTTLQYSPKFLRPKSVHQKSSADLRPKSCTIETLQFLDFNTKFSNSTSPTHHKPTISLLENDFTGLSEELSVKSKVKNFESLSLQNIRVIDEAPFDRQIHSANELTSNSCLWSNRRNSRSTDCLTSSHSCYEFSGLFDTSHKKDFFEGNKDDNFLPPNRKYSKINVQTQIQKLELNKNDQSHTSPRKRPHTLPQQEAHVMEIKKIFEKETNSEEMVFENGENSNKLDIVALNDTYIIINNFNNNNNTNNNTNDNNNNNNSTNNNNNVDDVLMNNDNNQLMDVDRYDETYGLLDSEEGLIFGDLFDEVEFNKYYSLYSESKC